MTFMSSYRRISARLFNKFVETRLTKFSGIHHDLRMANLGIMFREYISICFFTTLLTLIISFPVSFLLLYLVGLSIKSVLLFSLIITLVLTASVFMFMLKYPAIRADERKKNIDINLPFATLYMNTIAGTGAPPQAIFKLLANFKEYGEVSREAQEIVKDVEVMGQDIEVALNNAAERSPSEDFKDLLWSMITTIVRGGDLRSMLQEKSDYLMEKYQRKMEEYTNDLSLYVEVYITLVIVGSIFSIVMLTIMGAISGFEALKPMQELLVYVFLPLSSLSFIVLLKLVSPIS